MTDPAAYWPAALAEHTQVRDRLLAAYDDEHRGYHDRRHLAEVLEHTTTIIDHDFPAQTGPGGVDREVVWLAAWFHDAVYKPESPTRELTGESSEERSALMAERELATAGAPSAVVDEVARLVRLTAHHRPAAEDLAGQVLCDADLAILAAPRERYAEYVAGVRAEHADVPDEEFRGGRAAVLRDLLDKATLFHTAYAQDRWEEPARANLAREVAELG